MSVTTTEDNGPGRGGEGVFIALFHRSRAVLLLVAMFLQILLSPFGYPDSILPLVMRECIVLAAVFMAADTRRHLVIGLSLGIPSFIMLLVSNGTDTPVTDLIAYLMVLALYLFIIRLMLNKIFYAKVVTVKIIVLGLCTYLLLGQIWMLFYAPLAAYDPGAFSQPIVTEGSDAGLTLTYFSYVTLTTLGYGDISPVSPWARALAMLEALTGTLFLAVLISRLVGTYRSSSDRERLSEMMGKDPD
jgi:hypothetical protein